MAERLTTERAFRESAFRSRDRTGIAAPAMHAFANEPAATGTTHNVASAPVIFGTRRNARQKRHTVCPMEHTCQRLMAHSARQRENWNQRTPTDGPGKFARFRVRMRYQESLPTAIFKVIRLIKFLYHSFFQTETNNSPSSTLNLLHRNW